MIEKAPFGMTRVDLSTADNRSFTNLPRTKTSNFRKTSKSFYCRVAGTKFIAAINYVRFVLFSLDREWRKNVLEIKIRPAL